MSLPRSLWSNLSFNVPGLQRWYRWNFSNAGLRAAYLCHQAHQHHVLKPTISCPWLSSTYISGCLTCSSGRSRVSKSWQIWNYTICLRWSLNQALEYEQFTTTVFEWKNKIQRIKYVLSSSSYIFSRHLNSFDVDRRVFPFSSSASLVSSNPRCLSSQNRPSSVFLSLWCRQALQASVTLSVLVPRLLVTGSAPQTRH